LPGRQINLKRDESFSSPNNQRHIWQQSGYEISAAIHCEPLVFRQTTIYVSG